MEKSSTTKRVSKNVRLAILGASPVVRLLYYGASGRGILRQTSKANMRVYF